MNWRERIIKEMEKVEPDLIEAGFDDSEWEPYMKKAMELIARTMTPSIRLKEGAVFSSKELGGVVGHKYAYVKAFADGLHLSNVSASKITNEVSEMLNEGTEMLREYFPAVRRTVRRCLTRRRCCV